MPTHTRSDCGRQKKQKQSKVARVELRAGAGLHGPEKPGWSMYVSMYTLFTVGQKLSSIYIKKIHS